MGMFSAAVISCSWEGMEGRGVTQLFSHVTVSWGYLLRQTSCDLLRPKEARWNFITHYVSKSHAAYTMRQRLLWHFVLTCEKGYRKRDEPGACDPVSFAAPAQSWCWGRKQKERRNVANVIGEAGVSFSTKRRIVPDVVARQMAPPCLLEGSSASVWEQSADSQAQGHIF